MDQPVSNLNQEELLRQSINRTISRLRIEVILNSVGVIVAAFILLFFLLTEKLFILFTFATLSLWITLQSPLFVFSLIVLFLLIYLLKPYPTVSVIFASLSLILYSIPLLVFVILLLVHGKDFPIFLTTLFLTSIKDASSGNFLQPLLNIYWIYLVPFSVFNYSFIRIIFVSRKLGKLALQAPVEVVSQAKQAHQYALTKFLSFRNFYLFLAFLQVLVFIGFEFWGIQSVFPLLKRSFDTGTAVNRYQFFRLLEGFAFMISGIYPLVLAFNLSRISQKIKNAPLNALDHIRFFIIGFYLFTIPLFLLALFSGASLFDSPSIDQSIISLISAYLLYYHFGLILVSLPFLIIMIVSYFKIKKTYTNLGGANLSDPLIK